MAQNYPQLISVKLQLIDPQAIKFNGMTVVFAREQDKNTDKLYYNVRIENIDSTDELQEYSGWHALDFDMTDKEQPEKEVLRVLGSSLVSVPAFASTPITKDAPFCVRSDEKYITIFRLSEHGTLYVDRFFLIQGTAEPADDKASKDYTKYYVLDRVWELRYRNSNNKIVPADDQDVLGYKDRLDQTFQEPTLELVNLPKLTAGNFTIELLTSINDVKKKRWYFFMIVENSVQVYSWQQSADGLFDFREEPESFTFQPGFSSGGFQKFGCAAGIASTTYSQQEETADKKTVKSALRLMLAVPVSHKYFPNRALAIYDFGILPDGQIANPNVEELASPVLDGKIESGVFIPLTTSAPYPVSQEAVLTTLYHYILGAVQTTVSPALLNSYDGLVHCYYPSRENDFLVAQFDPKITRPLVQLEWVTADNTKGKLDLKATRAGTSLNDWTVQVKDGITPDLCEVIINYETVTNESSKPNERWFGMPRDLTRFARILKGEASNEISAIAVQDGSTPFFDYDNRFYQLRLELKSTEHPSWLTLLSTRPDLVLDTATIKPGKNENCNLDLSLRFITDDSSNGKIIILKWNDIPTKIDVFRSIIRGDAAPDTYLYQANETKALGLEAEGGKILIFMDKNIKPVEKVKEKASDPVTFKPYISIAKSSDSDTLNVTINYLLENETKEINLTKVSANVKKFTQALLNHADLKASITGISVGEMPVDDKGKEIERKVSVQTISQLLDLRDLSTLFSSLPATHPIAAYTETNYKASKLQGREYRDNKVNSLYVLNSVIQPSNGQTALISNQSEKTANDGFNGKWVVANPLYSLILDGQSAMLVPDTSSDFDQLAPRIEFTFETWLKPQSIQESRLVSFKGPVENSTVKPQYFVNVKTKPCLELVGNASEKTNSFISTTASTLLNPDKEFTIETWIRPSAPDKHDGIFIQLTDQKTNIYLELSLIRTPDQQVYNLGISAQDDTRQTLKLRIENSSNPGVFVDRWSHVAVTGNCYQNTGEWDLEAYINGIKYVIVDRKNKETNRLKNIQATEGGMIFSLGAGKAGASKALLIDSGYSELRYWNTQRLQSEINDRMDSLLTEVNDNLVVYWHLSESLSTSGTEYPDKFTFANSSKHKTVLDGTYRQIGNKPSKQIPDGLMVDLTAGIGDAPIQKTKYLHKPLKNWDHVAVTYRAGTGVKLTAANKDYVNCRVSSSFNFADKFTLECWIQADKSATTKTRCLISKWGETEDQQSYWLGLDSAGNLVFKNYFVIKGKDVNKKQLCTYTLKKGTSLADGHIAVTIAVIATNTSTTVTYKAEVAVYNNGVICGGDFDTRPQETKTSNLLVDAVSDLTTTVTLQETSSPLLIGATHLNATTINGKINYKISDYFNGKITGVILLSDKVTQSYITDSYTKHDALTRKNAVVCWWFSEQSGLVAKDNNNNPDIAAKLSSNSLWTVFEPLSTITFIANGALLIGDGVTDSGSNSNYTFGTKEKGFALGGCPDVSKVLLPFTGQLNETRIWGRTLSPAEILQRRFRPLTGREPGLLGYWNFDGQQLKDQSPNVNDGQMFPVSTKIDTIFSTAPLSNEDPAVRNIFGGQKTQFQQKLYGTPAIIEFSNTNRKVTNGIDSIDANLQRSYYFTKDVSAFNLEPGFYLGALDKLYLGQQQGQPTLIGFIEGAPPVPSENLTRPYYNPDIAGGNAGRFDYFDASSIRFNDIETTSTDYKISYASSEVTNTMSSTGLYVDSETLAGLGFAQKIFKYETLVLLKTNNEQIKTDSQATQSISTWTVSSSDNLGLRGNWETEDEQAQLNITVGRRFLPDNTGYALVKSLTFDIYLLIHRDTGAAIDQLVVPNLDIPIDNNIIHFRINPGYTKNGTLDGKVGLYNDPDYPTADTVRGSYFMPKEAYKFKDKINKRNTELQAYYQQYNQKITLVNTISSSTLTLDTMGQTKYRLIERTPNPVALQGIANTYVWTALGGMHTEQQEFSDVYTETYTGVFGTLDQKGPAEAIKLSPIISSEFEHLGGWQVDLSNEKSRTVTSSLGLDVVVNGESYLGWNGNKDTNGCSEQPIPGKVNAYRFNTFYLPPDADNATEFFDRVIDPVWLQSNDPDAIALRSVNRACKPWRVLHRVTYVNRVPPDRNDRPTQSLSKPKAQISDLYNNRFIVDLVLAILGEGATLATPAQIGKAVITLLNSDYSAPKSMLGEKIFWWDAFVLSTKATDDKQKENQQKANLLLLQTLQRNIINYLITGIAEKDFE